MKVENPYMLYPHRLRYLIIPTCECLKDIPFPNQYLSFWFKENAKVVLSAMNLAWKDGYRYSNIFNG